MGNKILIIFFLAFWLIAHDINSNPVTANAEQYFKTFADVVNHYQTKPLGKVLVFAYDSPSKWVAQIGYAEANHEHALKTATAQCERLRNERNISSQCKVFAIEGEFYYDKYNPTELLIVNRRGEKPIPSAPPASAPGLGPGYAGQPPEVYPPGRGPSSAPKSELKRKEEISYGTGFAVRSDGLILTSYHIVSGADSIAVSYQSGKLVTATLIKHSSNNDLALLKIKDKTPQYLDLEEPGNVNIGDRVFTIGFPVMKILGTEPKYSEGTISSLAGVRDEASFMQISVPIQPGNSGGPLINEKGKVVGVITSTAAVVHFLETSGTLPQNVNWAVKSDIAKTLYKAQKSNKPKKMDRQATINHTTDSVCLVVVSKTK